MLGHQLLVYRRASWSSAPAAATAVVHVSSSTPRIAVEPAPLYWGHANARAGTKLFFPAPRPQITSRPRLFKRLSDELGASRKLSVVCAPAGFGKTTLLSEWITQRIGQHPGVGIAWLSLDAHDNDPLRFLAYVVAALQGVDAESALRSRA